MPCGIDISLFFAILSLRMEKQLILQKAAIT